MSWPERGRAARRGAARPDRAPAGVPQGAAAPVALRGVAAVPRRAALGLLLGLAGCGFRPAFGPGGPYGRIRADDPIDRYGYEFLRRFERQMGLPEAPAYALSYRMTLEEEGVAGASTSTTTRFQVRGRVDYAVRDIATGQELHRDSASSFTAYSTLGTTISERAAQEAACNRLADQLADQVATGLMASYAGWARPAGAP